MKVVHLSYGDSAGGAFKAAYRIHRGVRDLGVNSTMLVASRLTSDPDVLDSGSAAGRAWSRTVPYLDILPWKLFRIPRDQYTSLSWVGTGVGRRVRAHAPDLVHLHWICAGFMRVETLARLRTPLIWRLADMWAFVGAEHHVGDDVRYIEGYTRERRPPQERGPDLNRWVWNRKRRTYARIRNMTIVTPSRWLARCAAQSVLLRDRRIEVIPTGQDTSIFRPMPREVARQALGLPVDARFVMTASMGLGDRHKGVHLLLQALESLAGRGYRLLLVGSPPGTLPQLPIETHWTGHLNDQESMALAYSAANVFVAPSMAENLPNTVIEAMACGIPCVAFSIGGIPDLIRPDRNGYLAKPFDTDDLARGIVSIMESGEAYDRLSHEARQTILTEFPVELQAQRYSALYEDVLRTASPNLR